MATTHPTTTGYFQAVFQEGIGTLYVASTEGGKVYTAPKRGRILRVPYTSTPAPEAIQSAFEAALPKLDGWKVGGYLKNGYWVGPEVERSEKIPF